MLRVTKTYLPPLEDYVKYLKRIWESHHLTNGGPLVQELEARIKKYLGVKHFFFTSNGTVAIQLAIKALGIKKNVITTPFTYVATVNSLLWENCQPIFVDIDPENFSIQSELIEAAITPETEAILAVHVYGLPGDLKKTQEIATKHNLHLIYDGAHAFGVEIEGKSIFNFGDISTFSFHATKLVQSAEGGGIATNNDEIAEKIALYRSFGHKEDDYYCVGINGKNSELHAAMGLCSLDHLEEILENRKRISELYNRSLQNVPVFLPSVPSHIKHNYSYYPVLFKTEEQLLHVRDLLLERNISPRRYFYPSLNTLPFINGNPCPVSEDIACRVLCLPISYYSTAEETKMTSDIIKTALL